MQELKLGFYAKVRFATAPEEADSNRQFVPDSTLEGDGFELPVPVARSLRSRAFCGGQRHFSHSCVSRVLQLLTHGAGYATTTRCSTVHASGCAKEPKEDF